MREREGPELAGERLGVVQHHAPLLIHEVGEEADEDEPAHPGPLDPLTLEALEFGLLAFDPLTFDALEQRVDTVDEEPSIELAEIGEGLRSGRRGHGDDDGLVVPRDRGRHPYVPYVARRDLDAVSREVGIPTWIADHGGDLVPPTACLGGDGPAGPATGSEDGDAAHFPCSLLVTRWWDSLGQGRYSREPGYFNGTWASLGRVLPELDPDMFDPLCPSSALPIQIGDKWTGMIVLCLEHGRRRFNEIKVPLRGITSKVLSETLRAMERDGLVVRTAYPENPPRVEYELTPLGRTLLTLIDAARTWSRAHLPTLLDARQAYEAGLTGQPVPPVTSPDR
ncbi:hypothetical protein GCM10027290_62850 [Micromonospora sonneratiae]